VKRFVSFTFFLLACRPGIEQVYEKSFELRAARELAAIGDTTGARYYLKRALGDAAARSEANRFLAQLSDRREASLDCVAAKRADLAINQYPRVRHKNLFQLAVCLEGAGEETRALATYNLSENAGSTQPQLYLRRGFLKERLGDTQGSKLDFERAIKLNAGYFPAELGYAMFLLRSGETAPGRKMEKPFYAEIVADAGKNRDALKNDAAIRTVSHGR